MIVLKEWLGLAIVGLVGLFIVSFFKSTYYTIYPNGKLKIVCSFFRKTIDIKQITVAKRSNSLLSGPALSLDRMEIVYNLGKRIIISPENPEKFVADLKKHHPQIVYPDEKAL